MTTNLHSSGRPLTQGWRNKASIVQAFVHVHVLIQYRYLQSRSTYFLWWRTCQIAISCKGGPPRFSSGVGMQKSCSQRRSSFHAFSQLFSSHRPLLRLVQLHAALILRSTEYGVHTSSEFRIWNRWQGILTRGKFPLKAAPLILYHIHGHTPVQMKGKWIGSTWP